MLLVKINIIININKNRFVFVFDFLLETIYLKLASGDVTDFKLV